MLREACVCKRDAPKCVRIRLWPVRRDDSSRALIGAAGLWRSDWRRRNVGALIGQSACRLLACTRAAIDSTRARASGSFQASTTCPPELFLFNSFTLSRIVYYNIYRFFIIVSCRSCQQSQPARIRWSLYQSYFVPDLGIFFIANAFGDQIRN